MLTINICKLQYWGNDLFIILFGKGSRGFFVTWSKLFTLRTCFRKCISFEVLRLSVVVRGDASGFWCRRMLLCASCVLGWCWAPNVGKLCSCRRVPCHVVMNSSWSLPLSTNRKANTGSVLPVLSKKVISTYDKTWGFLLLIKTSEDTLINFAMVCSSLACSQCTDDLIGLYQKL